MDDKVVSYIAGFFDGEGSVTFNFPKSSKNGKRYGKLQARISQNDRNVLEWIKGVMGVGTIHARKRNVEHPNWNLQHDYIVGSEAARYFLATIRPFTIVKSTVIDEKLALDAIHCKRRKRDLT